MKPTEQPDGYWIAVSDKNHRQRKHTNEDCPMLTKANETTYKPASVIEHRKTCEMCEGRDDGTGASGKANVDRCPLCGEEGVSRLPAHLPCDGGSDE